MTDDSKPKGPVLPGTTKHSSEGEVSLIRKINNKVVDIGKEKPTDSKKIKEKKRAHQQERKKRSIQQNREKADKVEKASPEDSLKEIQKKEREKHNDKQAKEKIRKRQQKIVKFTTHLLPPIVTAALGKAANKIKGHPLVSSKSSGAADPRLSSDTAQNPDSRPQLQLLNEKRNELTHQQTLTTTPTFRPPGG